MSACKTRAAELADIESLLTIEEACFLDFKEVSRRSFQRFIKFNHTPIFVITVDKHVCGYLLALLRKNSRKARLYSLAILPNFQGQGLAGKLIVAMEEYLIKLAYQEIHLEVRQDNHSGIRFYEKHGYTIFGEYQNYYADGGAAWRMRKIINLDFA